MSPHEYNALARQLAAECISALRESGSYADLNLAGQARLHNWVQAGAGSQAALSSLHGEPVIVKVIVQLERPNSEQAHD